MIEWSGALGRFEIATENYEDWQPGRTFSSPTVGSTQTVSLVSIVADNTGKIRLHVLTSSAAQDRLLGDVRAIVRSEMSSMSYAGVWEYTVAPSLLGSLSTIDAISSDPRMPDLTNVPMMPGLLGSAVTPSVGAKCRIHFVNQNPARPECIGVAGATEHTTTIEAVVVLLHNTLAALFLANPGIMIGAPLQLFILPAINAAIAATGIPAPPGLPAQIIAAATQTAASVAGSPISTSAPYSAALAILDTKVADASGLFPSVGHPNSGIE